MKSAAQDKNIFSLFTETMIFVKAKGTVSMHNVDVYLHTEEYHKETNQQS